MSGEGEKKPLKPCCACPETKVWYLFFYISISNWFYKQSMYKT